MQRTATRRHTRHGQYNLAADLERIKNAFADTAFDVRGRAGQLINDSFQTIKDKSVEVQDTVADYTAEKPFRSLGAAALVGLFLGLYITRSRK